MGGATLASGSDLASASWNPASLARMQALEFALTHAPLPGGATQDWLAAGGRTRGDWRWSAQALFHREGGIEGRDAANNPTGDLTASDVGVSAQFARRFGGRVDAGLGAEWVHESLAGTPGSGLAFSGGVRADAGAFGFALAARHLGGGMSYGGTRYDLPGVIAAGMSYEDPVRGLRVAADLESPTHYYRSLRVGGEWLWRGQFALRAGYRSELGNQDAARLSGASFGMGTGAGSLWMDYAFTPEGGQGAGEHRLGLTYRPGGNVQSRSATSERTTPSAPTAAVMRKRAPAASSAPATSQAKPPATTEKIAAPASPPASTSSAASAPTTGDTNTPVPAPVTPAPGAAATLSMPSKAKSEPTSTAAAPNAKASGEATSKPAETASPKPAATASTAAPAKPATPDAKPTAGVSTPAPAKSAASPTAAAAPAVAKPAPASSAPAARASAATAASGAQPGSEKVTEQTPKTVPVATPPQRPSVVIVAEGETMAIIARRWGTSVPAIMMANNLVNARVTPGKRLKLPPAVKK